MVRVVVHTSVDHPVVQWVHQEVADHLVHHSVLLDQAASEADMASQEEVDKASQEAVAQASQEAEDHQDHQDHPAVEALLAHQAVAREATTTEDGWLHPHGHRIKV